MPSNPLSSPDEETKAFQKVTKALKDDMPLLMHGSGDVAPAEVNPDTAQLVAELTAQYLSRLVDAAVDSHDLLTDGAGGVLPPPPYLHRPEPRYLRPEPKRTEIAPGTDKRKRRLARQNFWDQPQPDPIIRNKGGRSSKTSPARTHNTSSSSAPSASPARAPERPEKKVSAKMAEWIGIAGVDLFQESRARRAHVSTPSTIGPRNFIFPICHDAQLYGRIIELQSARRNIASLLVDDTIMEMIKTEGAMVRKKRRLDKKNASKNKGNNGENEEELDEDDEEAAADDKAEASWPGLDALLHLPIHQFAEET